MGCAAAVTARLRMNNMTTKKRFATMRFSGRESDDQNEEWDGNMSDEDGGRPSPSFCSVKTFKSKMVLRSKVLGIFIGTLLKKLTTGEDSLQCFWCILEDAIFSLERTIS